MDRCFIYVLELPALLPLPEVAQALLHVANGPWLLCRLVANAPESYDEGRQLIIF